MLLGAHKELNFRMKPYSSIDKKPSNKTLPVIFLFAVSFIILYFSTASSPRYAINPWVDSNAFFTVGKAMANNMVPYKDIFEQKGPLLYLIHAIAYLISKTSFTGVYILESLSFGVTAAFIFKISKKYISDFASVIVSVLSVTVMVLSVCFYYGDSAEEFCMPFLSVGLYYYLEYFKNSQNNLKLSVFLLCGFSAGCVALIKFTVLGFWFGWMAAIALHTLIIKREVKNAFRFSFIFLFGMILAFAPWIAYFVYKNALKDFIDVYFVINATSYADYSTSQNGLKIWVAEFLSRYYLNFRKSTVFAVCSLLGTVSTVFVGKITDKKFCSRFSVFFIFLTTMFFTYVGGTSFQYYFFVFGIFVCLLFIVFFILSEQIINKLNFKTDFKAVKSIAAILVSVLSVILSMNYSVSAKAAVRINEKENTYQYVFSQYIKENSSTQNPKVFSYNCLDSGIYVFNDFIPEFRFFELQNIPYENFPDNLDAHIRYINDHIAEYVVTLSEIPSDDKSNLLQDYRLVKEMQFPVFSSENMKIKYSTAYLYELNQGDSKWKL